MADSQPPHGYLESLYVSGFKSFSAQEPQTLCFSPGANVVSGANGAGKSNVIDAVLFAMTAPESDLRVARLRQTLHCEGARQARCATVELTFAFPPRTSAGGSEEAQAVVLTARLFRDSDERKYRLQGRAHTAQEVRRWLQRRLCIDVRVPSFAVLQNAVVSLPGKCPAELGAVLAQAAGSAAVRAAAADARRLAAEWAALRPAAARAAAAARTRLDAACRARGAAAGAQRLRAALERAEASHALQAALLLLLRRGAATDAVAAAAAAAAHASSAQAAREAEERAAAAVLRGAAAAERAAEEAAAEPLAALEAAHEAVAAAEEAVAAAEAAAAAAAARRGEGRRAAEARAVELAALQGAWAAAEGRRRVLELRGGSDASLRPPTAAEAAALARRLEGSRAALAAAEAASGEEAARVEAAEEAAAARAGRAALEAQAEGQAQARNEAEDALVEVRGEIRRGVACLARFGGGGGASTLLAALTPRSAEVVDRWGAALDAAVGGRWGVELCGTAGEAQALLAAARGSGRAAAVWALAELPRGRCSLVAAAPEGLEAVAVPPASLLRYDAGVEAAVEKVFDRMLFVDDAGGGCAGMVERLVGTGCTVVTAAGTVHARGGATVTGGHADASASPLRARAAAAGLQARARVLEDRVSAAAAAEVRIRDELLRTTAAARNVAAAHARAARAGAAVRELRPRVAALEAEASVAAAAAAAAAAGAGGCAAPAVSAAAVAEARAAAAALHSQVIDAEAAVAVLREFEEEEEEGGGGGGGCGEGDLRLLHRAREQRLVERCALADAAAAADERAAAARAAAGAARRGQEAAASRAREAAAAGAAAACEAAAAERRRAEAEAALDGGAVPVGVRRRAEGMVDAAEAQGVDAVAAGLRRLELERSRLRAERAAALAEGAAPAAAGCGEEDVAVLERAVGEAEAAVAGVQALAAAAEAAATSARLAEALRARDADALAVCGRRFARHLLGVGEGRFQKAELRGEGDGVAVSVDGAPLALFSGGQKTLIAMSFLLAVADYRPAPFYLLDEVDAALDESNQEAVAGLVASSLGRRQVVCVTHHPAFRRHAHKILHLSNDGGTGTRLTHTSTREQPGPQDAAKRVRRGA